MAQKLQARDRYLEGTSLLFRYNKSVLWLKWQKNGYICSNRVWLLKKYLNLIEKHFIFQAICHPLANLMSTKRRSIQKSHMLAIAWILSIVFSIPQLFVFQQQEGKENCIFDVPEWGKKVKYRYFHNSSHTLVEVSPIL